MIVLRKYKPSDMPEEALKSSIDLIQSKFNLTSESLNTILLNKDILHLYYNASKLIGIVGFKWVVLDSAVFLYIGTTTIEDRYQKSGLLSRSITSSSLYTLTHFPFKKYKFILGFVTTPQAYQYTTAFNNSWPQPEINTPTEILELLKSFMRSIGDDHYYIKNGAVICTQLSEIYELKPKKIENKVIKDYFNSITSNGTPGLQVMCIAPISLRNACHVIFRVLLKKSRHLFQHLKLFFFHKNSL